MLLTSAQVSVAISSTIVSVFTITLFLSGYVLQQRTVNNIREAIKPKVRPVHVFAPEVVSTVQTTVQVTGTSVPQANDVSIVIEIPNSNNTPGKDMAEEQEHTGHEVEEDATARGEQMDRPQENFPSVTQQEVISDIEPLVSSRIRRPSQVENDKKDKEWAAQLKKSQTGNGGYEDVPFEQLSRAARRKIFKQQLSVQEGQQPVDPRAYRPRRRLW